MALVFINEHWKGENMEAEENEMVITHCPDILRFMRCRDIRCEDGQRSRGEDADKDICILSQIEEWVKWVWMNEYKKKGAPRPAQGRSGEEVEVGWAEYSTQTQTNKTPTDRQTDKTQTDKT